MREKRLYGPFAVAGLLCQKGKVLLTKRKDFWTLPTGNMDVKRDSDSESAFVREMKEELVGLKTLDIVESLGSFLRHPELEKNKSSPYQPKIIEIFFGNISGRIKYLLERGERKKVIWMRPSEAIKMPNLDELAITAITRFLEKYPSRKPTKQKGGNNEHRGHIRETSNKNSIVMDSQVACR